MRKPPHFNIGRYWRLGIFLVLSLGYFWLNQDGAIVNIHLVTKTSSTFTMYWAGEGEGFSQTRANDIRIFPKVNHYSMKIGDLDRIKKLRIDPLEDKGKFRLVSLRIRQKGFEPVVYKGSDDLRQFVPDPYIKKTWVDSSGLWVISSALDPKLHLDLQPVRVSGESKHDYTAYVFFLLLSIFPYHRVVGVDFEFVPCLMLVVLVLIFIMASLSRYNKHPDEYVHHQAAKYYEHHLKPPAICAPETEKTYSVYGVSKLNSYEMAYFFAGKFSGLWGFLPIDSYHRVRYFNVVLWIVLTILALRSVPCRLLFVPLLISPQIWYLFSYCNSDAFALFLLFIISYLIVDDRSILKTYFEIPTFNSVQVIKGIVLGILLGMLFLLKLNYYFYIIFIASAGTVTLMLNRKKQFKHNVGKIVVITLVAFFVVGARMVWDVHVNGFDKSAKVLECREKLANKIYKPSTPIERKAGILQLKQRGVSLQKFLSDYDYFTILFRSGTGVYGYMEMAAQNGYYRFMLALMILFTVIGLFYSFYNSPSNVKILAAIVLCCGIMIVLAAAWKSWTSVFQPQGRYIFPILPMVGILYNIVKNSVPKHLLTFVVAGLFIGSLYSFIWIGLVNIPTI